MAKGPHEYKQALNRAKRRHRPRNGVLGAWWFDNFWGLWGLANSKRNYKRAAAKENFRSKAERQDNDRGEG